MMIAINNAATNIGVHIFFWVRIFLFFGYICKSGIADSFSPWGTSILFSMVAINLHSHQQCRRIPFFSTHSPGFIVNFFDDSYSNDSNELIIFFGKMSIQVLCLLLNWIVYFWYWVIWALCIICILTT